MSSAFLVFCLFVISLVFTKIALPYQKGKKIFHLFSILKSSFSSKLSLSLLLNYIIIYIFNFMLSKNVPSPFSSCIFCYFTVYHRFYPVLSHYSLILLCSHSIILFFPFRVYYFLFPFCFSVAPFLFILFPFHHSIIPFIVSFIPFHCLSCISFLIL